MHSLVVLGAVPTPHFTHVELNLFVTGKARPGQSYNDSHNLTLDVRNNNRIFVELPSLTDFNRQVWLNCDELKT